MNVKLFLIKKIIKTKPSKCCAQPTPEPVRTCESKQTKVKVKKSTKKTYPLTV